MTLELEPAQARLAAYALAFLEASLDHDLEIEAAQEVDPGTQANGVPLPDIRVMIADLRHRLGGFRHTVDRDDGDSP